MIQNSPINIILLGDPAAGKATHAAFLCRRFKMYDLDMGKELRKISKRKSQITRVLKNTLNKGKLTPTVIVRKILFEKIHSTPHTQGILFDGTPKMIGEAKLVSKWLKSEKRTNPLVIYLTIPISETVRRMTERKQDFKGKFSRRADDNEAALKERVKYYRKNIKEVLKLFAEIYNFKKISSNAPVPIVRKRLINIIGNYGKKLH